ncbi:MAG: hypothetical protein IPO05_04055 [Flavobacteriales bacterium]|nr:hypothetical protein [Flavobacteriales bacterium]
MAKLFATVNPATQRISCWKYPQRPWTFWRAPLDLVRSGPSSFSLVRNGRSHRVPVLKEDRENNTVRHAHRRAHLYREAGG